MSNRMTPMAIVGMVTGEKKKHPTAAAAHTMIESILSQR